MKRVVKQWLTAHSSQVQGKNIYVGLSGGVDSSVSAALLHEAGANVTGVFIKGWYPPGMPCTWAADRQDAMRVAAHLRIPFETLDASKEYKEGVIDYLLCEYRAGRTPNPDIMCNREVKFGAFYEYARSQGADFIATGHYAQNSNGSFMRGIDEGKDQSYFLWAVPHAVLTHTLFPLGGMQKANVRELAEHYKLPTALKRDSQGICFLGSISVEEFLTQEFGSEPGSAVTTDGTVVGEHLGALLSTLGQRIPLTNALPGPWYVLSKDIETNTLVVGRELLSATRTEFTLHETNWLRDPEVGSTYEAQYRYHGPRILGAYDVAQKTFTPRKTVLDPVASGQSLVLYEGEECLGGGIIG